jgi:hypothetical protein
MIDGVRFNPERIADTDWKIVGTGDFNGDQHPDLLLRHQSQGWIAAWLMNGVNLVAGLSLVPDRVTDLDWRVAATGDFDRDGQRDIVWQHLTSGRIAVWLMSGTRLRASVPLTPDRLADTNWRIVGAGHFNGDGKPDLVLQNQATGFLAIWLMDGTRLVSGVYMTPNRLADLDWKIRGVADINRDGLSDLIWQHVTSGKIAAWIMNGAVMVSGSSFSPGVVSDLNWKIVGPR